MASFRDTVMDALLAKLTADCGATFVSYSRRLMTYEALLQKKQTTNPILQPALYLFDGVGLGGGREKVEQRGRGRPPISILDRTIVVYAQLPGGGTSDGPDGT